MGASSHGDGPGARARASHHLTRYLINSKKVNASGGLGRFWSAGQGGAGLSDCARVLQTHVPYGPLRLSPLTSLRHSARHRLDDPGVRRATKPVDLMTLRFMGSGIQSYPSMEGMVCLMQRGQGEPAGRRTRAESGAPSPQYTKHQNTNPPSRSINRLLPRRAVFEAFVNPVVLVGHGGDVAGQPLVHQSGVGHQIVSWKIRQGR